MTSQIKAFSPEWNAREQAWADECSRNYEAAAAELVSQGYERRNHKRSLYPATFHKNGAEMILARQLGSSTWYATERPTK
jgi:hypothetical protein